MDLIKFGSIAVAMLFFFTVIPNQASATEVYMDESVETNEIEVSNEAIFTDTPIAIYSKNCLDKYTLDLSQSTSKISISEDFPANASEKVIIMDDSWIEDKSVSVVKETINSLISKEKVIALLSNNTTILSETSTGLSGFLNDAQACAIYEKDGQTYSYSVKGCSTGKEIMTYIYNWADGIVDKAKESKSIQTETGEVWIPEGDVSFNRTCGDLGFMYGSTQYYRLQEDIPHFNLYLTHYYFGAHTNIGCSKKGMTITNNVGADTVNGVGQSFAAADPTSHAIDTNGVVSVCPTTSYTDSNGSTQWVKPSWDYTVTCYNKGDIKVKVDKNYKDVTIKHEILETSLTAKRDILVEPGTLIVASKLNGGSDVYHSTEVYDVEFCAEVVDGHWYTRFTHYQESVPVQIPKP